MCGRYASARARIELLEEFGVQRDRVPAEPEPAPDYNVAPTKPVYAVLTRGRDHDRGHNRDGESDHDSEPGRGNGGGAPVRELRLVRWGLVPSWAKDLAIGSRLINARAETVSEKPAFRRAFARRRCLLPADGYYEWQQPGAAVTAQSPARGGKSAAKQPFYISRADGRPLAFAGLYELWRDRERPADDPGAWVWSAAIITTSAPDEIGRIHDRMPMIIDPGSWADWLDPAGEDLADLRSLLVPAGACGLAAYPVSTEVNSVRNNGPGLIEPAVPAGKGAPAPPGSQGLLGE